MAAKEYSKGDASRELSYIDSVKSYIADRYLDSMKKQTVYNILIAEYTYEECKKNAINLGLDLRGGMNVTLEVSVIDIVKNLSNNSADVPFNTALAETQKNLGVNNNDDFVTLFDKTYKRMVPDGRLAPLFQTIENKSKLPFNSSNEEVIKFINERVKEAIGNAEKTFRSRIDRFGVTQPNIQQLEGGRILVELPGVKDKARVRELLQGTANLEFWETYENGEIAQLFDKANFIVRSAVSPESIVAVKDTLANDTMAVATSTNPADVAAAAAKTDSLKKVDSLKNVAKTVDCFVFYRPD